MPIGTLMSPDMVPMHASRSLVPEFVQRAAVAQSVALLG